MRSSAFGPGLWLVVVALALPLVAAGIAWAEPTYPVADNMATPSVPPVALATGVENARSPVPENRYAEINNDADTLGAVGNPSAAGPAKPADATSNHGSYLRYLNEEALGYELGCLASTVARSDAGKPEQSMEQSETHAGGAGSGPDCEADGSDDQSASANGMGQAERGKVKPDQTKQGGGRP